MRIEVVVRGPHGEVVEQAATDCYLRSPGHGLAAQAHFALYLKSMPPPRDPQSRSRAGLLNAGSGRLDQDDKDAFKSYSRSCSSSRSH